MKSVKFAKKIRNYAIASFFVPLIAINSCMFIYKFLGHFDPYLDFNWNEKRIEHTLNEYNLIHNNSELLHVNCPIYKYKLFLVTTDNQTIAEISENANLVDSLYASNKIKSKILEQGKIKNDRCVKNYRFIYLLLNNFSALDKLLVNVKKKNSSGFVNIKNPYFYGEVSISRTARYFPATLIFKSLIILSALFLFSYWKNNLNFFTELKNNNILAKFSKKFFYLGMFSCIFLALHATFLGLNFDSLLFSKTRRLIIILFILLEIFAQIFLTKNLFGFREELKKYINPLILKIKIIFVIIVFFTTCLASTILTVGNPSTSLKHILEWNYFAFLLFYYLLSRLLWKAPKTQVHTPEGV